MAHGSVRHPLFSIGEGTFREKEARIEKQGLKKKKKPKKETKKVQLIVTPKDEMWVPQKMTNGNGIDETNIFKKDITKKIWGGKSK